MNLALAFAQSAAAHKEKPALFWGEQEFRYHALHQQAQAMAAELRESLGIRKGDRIGLWMKNCPEFIWAYFGILHAGAVVVPINNFLKPDEIGHILSDAGIDALVSDSSMAEGVQKLTDARKGLKNVRVEDVRPRSYEAQPQDLDVKETDLAVLIYTSGTTGRSKGAMLTHANLLANVES